MSSRCSLTGANPLLGPKGGIAIFGSAKCVSGITPTMRSFLLACAALLDPVGGRTAGADAPQQGMLQAERLLHTPVHASVWSLPREVLSRGNIVHTLECRDTSGSWARPLRNCSREMLNGTWSKAASSVPAKFPSLFFQVKSAMDRDGGLVALVLNQEQGVTVDASFAHDVSSNSVAELSEKPLCNEELRPEEYVQKRHDFLCGATHKGPGTGCAWFQDFVFNTTLGRCRMRSQQHAEAAQMAYVRTLTSKYAFRSCPGTCSGHIQSEKLYNQLMVRWVPSAIVAVVYTPAAFEEARELHAVVNATVPADSHGRQVLFLPLTPRKFAPELLRFESEEIRSGRVVPKTKNS